VNAGVCEYGVIEGELLTRRWLLIAASLERDEDFGGCELHIYRTTRDRREKALKHTVCKIPMSAARAHTSKTKRKLVRGNNRPASRLAVPILRLTFRVHIIFQK